MSPKLVGQKCGKSVVEAEQQGYLGPFQKIKVQQGGCGIDECGDEVLPQIGVSCWTTTFFGMVSCEYLNIWEFNTILPGDQWKNLSNLMMTSATSSPSKPGGCAMLP